MLLAACFFVVAVFMIDADRRAESVRLQQSTDLIVQAVESRLMGTTELLQKSSMRLIHIPGTPSRTAGAELAAMAFMQDRREVVDMALVDRDRKVLRHWASTSQSALMPDSPERRIDASAMYEPVRSVLTREAPVVTSPYSVKDTRQVFFDLFVPTPADDQVLMARINLSRLIADAANSVIGTTPYIFYLEADGKPVIASSSAHPPARSHIRRTFRSSTIRRSGS